MLLAWTTGRRGLDSIAIIVSLEREAFEYFCCSCPEQSTYHRSRLHHGDSAHGGFARFLPLLVDSVQQTPDTLGRLV